MSNIKVFKRAAAALTAGSPRQQIESIRARRLDLIEERKVADGARRPLAEAEAALGRLLDDIVAGLVDIDLSALSDHRARGLPEILRPNSDIGNKINDRLLLALIVASNRSGAREALSKVLRTGYEHTDTMTSSDREAKLAEIDAELLRLEIDEERIVRESEEAGMPILRRDDADPAVVLLRDLAA